MRNQNGLLQEKLLKWILKIHQLLHGKGVHIRWITSQKPETVYYTLGAIKESQCLCVGLGHRADVRVSEKWDLRDRDFSDLRCVWWGKSVARGFWHAVTAIVTIVSTASDQGTCRQCELWARCQTSMTWLQKGIPTMIPVRKCVTKLRQ